MTSIVSIPKQDDKKKIYKKKWFWIVLIIVAILSIVGGFLLKTGSVLDRISEGNSSIFGSLAGALPGGGNVADEDGRTNILLIGMRGQNIPGGGLLSDTIMILSIKPEENKVAMISIPRDLYVNIPGESYKNKINAVYAHGENGGKGNGMKETKEIVTQVSGLNIHHVIVLNFNGFKQLVDAVNGIEVTLDTPFYETSQFVQGNECGGQFELPQGKNTLNGEIALCYVRARENTSDFDRAKRQQIVLKALKDKLISVGTLTDFNKVNGILNAIGENVRTDMTTREMKNFYEEYSSMANAEIYQRVFENSEEGMLMVPQDAPEAAGYILIPRAGYDSYSEIHNVCENIFDLPPQSDIQPIKQYTKPAPKETDDDSDKKKDKKKKDKEDKDDKDDD